MKMLKFFIMPVLCTIVCLILIHTNSDIKGVIMICAVCLMYHISLGENW